jgi:hypothetical protein
MMKKALASIVAVLALTSTALAGSNYRLDLKAPSSAKKGEKATAKLHMEGTGEFHVNTEYPAKLTMDAPSGVTLDKAKQTGRDAVKFEKSGADFAIAFTSSDTGKKSFKGEFKFAVCTDNNCSPTSEKIAFDVDVQ